MDLSQTHLIRFGEFEIISYFKVVDDGSRYKKGSTFLELLHEDEEYSILLKDLNNDDKLEEVVIVPHKSDEDYTLSEVESEQEYGEVFRDCQKFLLDNLLIFADVNGHNYKSNLDFSYLYLPFGSSFTLN